MIDEACRQGSEWLHDGLPVAVSVNVSARQLDDDTLGHDIESALERTGMRPDHFIVELTESTLMRDIQNTKVRLNALKQLGIRIAIDDFGTGYSSLSHLRQFPVDVLKIDQSFIASLATSSQAEAIVHTLVQLGKTLGLETIAEGVEEAEQLERLRDEEVQTGQGFIYSKPLRPSDVPNFLRTHGQLEHLEKSTEGTGMTRHNFVT